MVSHHEISLDEHRAWFQRLQQDPSRILDGCFAELHALLDTCYPRPPRDVFYRFIERYRPGFPAWIARSADQQIIGFVHLAPNSKGGTLETLAVHPAHRGQGLARTLVQCLLDKTQGVISLTTRIPDFFSALSFESICTLPDQSVLMIQVRFGQPYPLTREARQADRW